MTKKIMRKKINLLPKVLVVILLTCSLASVINTQNPPAATPLPTVSIPNISAAPSLPKLPEIATPSTPNSTQAEQTAALPVLPPTPPQEAATSNPVTAIPATNTPPASPTAQPEKKDQPNTALPAGTEVLQIKEINDEKKQPSDADIFLNFENASLLSVVNYLGEQKKINIIPHKDLDAAKVSLSTRTPISLDRAWNILLTLLEMNGFSIIKVGPLYRVIPNKDNTFEPLPIFSTETGTELEALPDSDLVIRYIYFFKNIKAEMAQGILGTMLDAKNIIINKDLNACIIKDACFNIKASLRIIKELDLGGLREQIKIIPLRHANVDAVYKIFDEVLQLSSAAEKSIRFVGPSNQHERSYFSSSTRMYPDTTNNNLILLGSEKDLDKITDFIYKYIDVPMGSAECRLHIYELRYYDAIKLKPILDAVLKPPAGQGSDKSPMVGEYKFFEDVIISAEQTAADASSIGGGGNRLIIACNKSDWPRLQKLIAKLDKPQPQVAFEVLIVNVDSTVSKQLGVQHWGFKGKDLGLGTSNLEFANLSAAQNKKTDAEGTTTTDTVNQYIQLASSEYEGNGSPTLVTLGKAAIAGGDKANENIWAFIKAKFNINNSHVVSQPYIITNNYQKCTVSSTMSFRVAGGLVSGKGEPSKQSKETIDATMSIDITPRINLNGYVDLDLNVKVNEFTGTSVGDDATRTDRSLTTRATLYTGEVLILGGLTKTKEEDALYKTPLLGDIPILGNLFKNKTKSTYEENLYIFIRPSIIKPRFEGAPDEYTQLKLDYAKYQMMKNEGYGKERDPIQRWFFRPAGQSTQQALIDRAKGIFRPIDDFAFGKAMPKMVDIQHDPYYKVSEELKAKQLEREAQKRRQKELINSKTSAKTIELV